MLSPSFHRRCLHRTSTMFLSHIQSLPSSPRRAIATVPIPIVAHPMLASTLHSRCHRPHRPVTDVTTFTTVTQPLTSPPWHNHRHRPHRTVAALPTTQSLPSQSLPSPPSHSGYPPCHPRHPPPLPSSSCTLKPVPSTEPSTRSRRLDCCPTTQGIAAHSWMHSYQPRG
jgi:hypothetical protein